MKTMILMNTTQKFKDVLIPVILILSLIVCSYKAIGIQKKEKICLVLSGQVVKTTSNNTLITVQLIEENKVIDSLQVKTGETFKFNLREDRYYAVRVKQPGSVPRLISVSTWLPDDLREVKVYKFHFDLYQIQHEDQSVEAQDILDFPIALIKYDDVKGYFDYNSLYTTHIKSAYQKLRNMSSNFITTSL